MLDLYQKAIGRFYNFSSNDATAQLSRQHAILGLSKILSCYKEQSLNDDGVSVVALPDFTFTRNKFRWDDGFAYGCIILTNPKVTPIIPIGFRPNCCGVILSKISSGWDGNRKKLCEDIMKIMHSYEGIDMDDLKRRNHFVAILEDKDKNEFYIIFHGSFAQVKRDTPELPGLYFERSEHWKNKTKYLSNYKNFKYLIGDDALEYYSLYQSHASFTNKHRVQIFDDLFLGNHELVFHDTHEGFYDINTILLGAYVNQNKFSCPIMISADSDIEIVNNNTDLSLLTKGGIKREIYCSPHGGGYTWNYVKEAKLVEDFSEGGAMLTMNNNNSIMYCDNIGDMPFEYRKNVTNLWCEKHQVATKTKSLTPVFYAKF